MIARRLATREWWDAERKNFSLWASAFVEVELSAGVYRRQDECLKMIRRLRYLLPTAAMKELRENIIDRGLVPPTKTMDAAHLAISTSHSIDYLLTWNYSHMANSNAQERLESLCEELDLTSPLMVSPESIPQKRFGVSLRRRR